MGVVFAKTQKGHDEIATKAGGLSPRVRRILIFVDGKRSVEELRSMLLADDLQHTLGMLEEEGYIEFHDLTGVGPANSAPPSGYRRSPLLATCRSRPIRYACKWRATL